MPIRVERVAGARADERDGLINAHERRVAGVETPIAARQEDRIARRGSVNSGLNAVIAVCGHPKHCILSAVSLCYNCKCNDGLRGGQKFKCRSRPMVRITSYR